MALTIDGSTWLNVRMVTMVAIIVGVVGGALWANNLQRDVKDVQSDLTQLASDMAELRRFLMNTKGHTSPTP